MNFMKVGRKDPIPYDIDIDWKILCVQYLVVKIKTSF